VARPKLISPVTPVKPISATKRKYGIRKEPPPYNDTRVENIQIFPIPTAEPMQARIKPHRLLNDSLFFILFSLFLTFLNILSHLIGKSYSI